MRDKMETLQRVGLGYIKVGQQATTLSGGEAQRVKLSKELSRRATGKTLYILDEPTTGLHFHDVAKLLEVLHQLVDAGNTVAVIEHNLEVIKTADWVIDLGPGRRRRRRRIVAEGRPEDIAKAQESYTGKFLGRSRSAARRTARRALRLRLRSSYDKPGISPHRCPGFIRRVCLLASCPQRGDRGRPAGARPD